jgi:hypothetical protein
MVLSILLGACRQRESELTAAPSQAFDTIFRLQHSATLERTPQAPLVEIRAATIVGSRVVLDLARTDGKIYDRKSGRLLGVMGGPGDTFGNFRAPSAVAALDSGDFVIFDSRRNLFSLRDSLGQAKTERPVPAGFYNGLVAIPEDRRILLTGRMYQGAAQAVKSEIHEFSIDGELVASYGNGPSPRSEWESQFMAVFAAPWNGRLFAGSINSNVVRQYDRIAHKVQSFRVGKGWFRAFTYPSDAILHMNDSARMQRMTSWMHAQKMMNGVFALSHGRVIGRFQSFDGSGNRFYYYAVGDTLGQLYGVTDSTRAIVFMTKGDTVFWLRPQRDSAAILEEGFLALPRAISQGAATLH